MEVKLVDFPICSYANFCKFQPVCNKMYKQAAYNYKIGQEQHEIHWSIGAACRCIGKS